MTAIFRRRFNTGDEYDTQLGETPLVWNMSAYYDINDTTQNQGDVEGVLYKPMKDVTFGGAAQLTALAGAAALAMLAF